MSDIFEDVPEFEDASGFMRSRGRDSRSAPFMLGLRTPPSSLPITAMPFGSRLTTAPTLIP